MSTNKCTCLETIHTGPHWLHEDYFDARMNLRLLERALDAAEGGKANDALFLLLAYSQAEARRLKEKLLMMERNHIERISYAELGNGAKDDLPARERALKVRLCEVIGARLPIPPQERETGNAIF